MPPCPGWNRAPSCYQEIKNFKICVDAPASACRASPARLLGPSPDPAKTLAADRLRSPGRAAVLQARGLPGQVQGDDVAVGEAHPVGALGLDNPVAELLF